MAKTTIVQTSFNGGELSPYMEVRSDQARYSTGCKVLSNMLVAPHGAAYRRPGMRYMGDSMQQDKNKATRLIPFVFNEEQAYVLEFTDKFMRVWHKTGLILGAQSAPYFIATPYAGEDLSLLNYCQSADVLYIVHPKYPPMRLERMGHADWALKNIIFAPCIEPPKTTTATASGEKAREYKYVITAISAFDDEESLPCTPVSCLAANNLNSSNWVNLYWAQVEGAREYRIYRSGGGSGNYGFIGRAIGTSLIDRGQEADFSQGIPEKREPFAKSGDYPSVVQFYQQRLCFAASYNNPQTIWTSRSGSYHNVNVSYPLQADDACTITIAAERVNSIRWMMPLRKLLIGTVEGEWAMAGYGGEFLSPSSCEVERHGACGSAPLQPLVVGDSILYVQRGGNVVRESRYSLDSDGYGGINLSVLGEHLLRGKKIVNWAWQQNPHSVVWCVLNDGTMAGLSIIREHEVVAWHRHSTEGFVESIAVTPGTLGDDVWLVVRREKWDSLLGKWIEQRNIELLDSTLEASDSRKSFYLDSALSWNGEAKATFANLYHLEGKQVAVLADGSVHPPCTVKDAKVTLECPASIVHIGLSYTSDIAPMLTEPVAMQGVTLGMSKRVGRVRFRLYQSLGCKVGTHENNLREVVFRKVQHNLGQALPLFTGDLSTMVDSSVSTTGGVLLRQDDPLPFTLLSIGHELEIGEV